jgi:hypothetical protein
VYLKNSVIAQLRDPRVMGAEDPQSGRGRSAGRKRKLAFRYLR